MKLTYKETYIFLKTENQEMKLVINNIVSLNNNRKQNGCLCNKMNGLDRPDRGETSKRI